MTTITTTDTGYSGRATQGAEYQPGVYVTAAEIAANVRAKIKAAVKAGDLPGKADGMKYSVRSERFSGGQAVNINIIGPGEDDTAWAKRPVTDSQQDAQAAYRGQTHVYTDEARRIARLVESFGKAYTREDCDSMTDYFNVSCYIFVFCGSGGSSI
jgi:hypothetical protein